MNIFKPEVFQGNMSNMNYFEGWYFKQVSKNLDVVYSFIPGVSLNPERPHAFIQVINGITGETQYVEYPLSSFSYDKKKLWVKIADSVFTRDSIDLYIDSPLIHLSGQLYFSNAIDYPKTIFSPGIMGWYSFVPFMECKHGVVSVSHQIEGSLKINELNIDFTNGKGYIEKDWGRSFPESWIWLQSNHFQHSDACIMISIAKIPWIGSHFSGFLAFLYLDGKFYKFSTYNNSKITALSYKNQTVHIELKNKEYKLVVNAYLKNSGILMAPIAGKMNRRIKESVDSEIEITLTDSKGNYEYKDKAVRTGLEVIDGIFDIVKIPISQIKSINEIDSK